MENLKTKHKKQVNENTWWKDEEKTMIILKKRKEINARYR